MAFVKDWSYSYNITPADTTNLLGVAQSYLSKLVNKLESIGWVVTKTAIAGTVTTGSTAPTKAQWAWGSLGANRTWVVLRSPNNIVPGTSGTGDELYLTIEAGSDNCWEANFAFHQVPPTGGSATAAPTSSTMVVYPKQQFLYSNLNNSNVYFHFIGTTEGHFLTTLTAYGNNSIPFLLALFPMTSTATNSSNQPYAYPTATWCGFYEGGEGVFTPQRINVQSGTVTSAGGFFDTVGYISNEQYNINSSFDTPNRLQGWSHDGTPAALEMYFLATHMDVKVSYVNTTGVVYARNRVLGQGVPTEGDSFQASALSSPIWIMNPTVGKTALIGKLADITASFQPVYGNTTDGLTATSIYLGPSANYATDYTNPAVPIGGLWVPGSTALFM